MQITLLSSSPRAASNSRFLADAFAAGAISAGHQLQIFDLAKLKISPCTACDYCRNNDNNCCQDDDMQPIYQALEQSDALILATPLYYFGFSTQLKAAIDRLYAKPHFKRDSEEANAKLKYLGLICTAADQDEFVTDGIISNYGLICDYLALDNLGEIIAIGLAEQGEAQFHPAVAEATKLGQNLPIS